MTKGTQKLLQRRIQRLKHTAAGTVVGRG